MGTRVIVHNGGSSSGKSSIARQLQEVLPDPWLALGVDTLVAMLPPSLLGGGAGIDLAAGMARSQAALVHVGMAYDLEVDTTQSSPRECARLIAAHAR